MNDAAREAMTMAASEYDRFAAKVETTADLLRQIAEHARRGDIAEIERVREEISRIDDPGDELARRLIDSVRERDPEHWRAERRKVALRLVAQLPHHALAMFAATHGAVCEEGASCEVLHVARERIAAGK